MAHSSHTNRRRHYFGGSLISIRSHTEMVLSSSQQLVMAFTAVLLVFVLFPRMFSGSARDAQSFDPRISRRGAGASTSTPVFVYSLYCGLLTVFADLLHILLRLWFVKFVLTPLVYFRKCFLLSYLYL